MESGDQRGGLVPAPSRSTLLFDRLFEAEGPDSSGLPVPDSSGFSVPGGRQRVLNSLRGELSRLLNTRLSPGLAAEEAATVTGYGVPDWSLVNPGSAPQLSAMAETIAGQVRRFEPRLDQVRVQLWPDARRRNAATGTLEAVVAFDWAPEPVCFRLALEAHGVAVETEAT